jgi:hypothetical protein
LLDQQGHRGSQDRRALTALLLDLKACRAMWVQRVQTLRLLGHRVSPERQAYKANVASKALLERRSLACKAHRGSVASKDFVA